jgi:hypothetical protein
MSKKQRVFLVGGRKPVSMTPSDLKREVEAAGPQRYPGMSYDVPRFSIHVSGEEGRKDITWLATRETLSEFRDSVATTPFANMGNA